MTITEREATTPVQARVVTRAWWQAVRRHSFFLLVLTAGLVLRVLAQTAYRPALLYIDSEKYLEGSVATAPQGYQALLRLLEPRRVAKPRRAMRRRYLQAVRPWKSVNSCATPYSRPVNGC